MPGTMILAATPIGNLDDTTRRLENAVQQADVVIAEDTRHSQKLLHHLGTRRRLDSFHEHSPDQKLNHIARLLAQDKTIVYLSDAGTPGISDPGFELVRLAHTVGAHVDILPGPSAVICALVLSGLPVDRFAFMGFFPRKMKARENLLNHLSTMRMTSVHFESPKRILDCLEFLDYSIPDTPIAVCREMTKIHQETLRGTAREVLEKLTTPKGEIALVIGPITLLKRSSDPQSAYRQLRASGASHTQAIKTVSQQFGMSKRDIANQLENED